MAEGRVVRLAVPVAARGQEGGAEDDQSVNRRHGRAGPRAPLRRLHAPESRLARHGALGRPQLHAVDVDAHRRAGRLRHLRRRRGGDDRASPARDLVAAAAPPRNGIRVGACDPTRGPVDLCVGAATPRRRRGPIDALRRRRAAADGSASAPRPRGHGRSASAPPRPVVAHRPRTAPRSCWTTRSRTTSTTTTPSGTGSAS